ncbi:MAG: ECF-type sigma factor [Bythopirellula sp.]
MEFTQILRSANEGDTSDRANLIQASYDEVRKLAAGRMASARQDHTLTATALAHEASLRMLGDNQLPTENRGKFFAYVMTVMRNLLIDHARLRGRQKRGGHLRKRSFDDAHIAGKEQREDFLALEEALKRLAEVEPRMAQVVEMRFYSGMSNREIAKTLGIALSTVKRDWADAKAWLLEELQGDVLVSSDSKAAMT